MELKEFRKLKGLTQTQLAREIECTHPTISRIETGKINPGRELMKRIYAYTKGAVTPNDFMVLDKEAI